MKKYSKYKDSGVEWVGEIPDEWDIVKLKYLCSISTGDKDTQNRIDNGLYPFYVRSQQVERINSYSFDGEAVLTAGDGAGTGKIFHYVNGKFDFHQRVYKFSNFRRILGKYFFWYIKTNFINVTEDQNSKSTVDSLRLPLIQNFQFVFPCILDQLNIMEFLDQKTNIIDCLIKMKFKKIELLKEQRTSMINQAVTKGLNTDVGLIDSGVKWIGSIPEHWNLKKIKYLFEIRKRIAGKLGYDVLSVTQSGIRIKDIISGEGQLSMDYSKYQLVLPDDFVMNHMDLLTGYVDISKYSGVTSPDYRVFTLIDNKSVKGYYLYLFQFCYINKIFYGLGHGSSMFGRWRLSSDEFNEFLFPNPPLVEQHLIVDYLDKKTSEIDKQVDLENRKIDLLKEYRQSLISEVVTGKIDVRTN